MLPLQLGCGYWNFQRLLLPAESSALLLKLQHMPHTQKKSTDHKPNGNGGQLPCTPDLHIQLSTRPLYPEGCNLTCSKLNLSSSFKPPHLHAHPPCSLCATSAKRMRSRSQVPHAHSSKAETDILSEFLLPISFPYQLLWCLPPKSFWKRHSAPCLPPSL